ncbi:MAG: penicillin-binding protein activator [SAR324 cluster bacterium]|nr:penicillin-binding protein activator [SAR324 cluster bacterium]
MISTIPVILFFALLQGNNTFAQSLFSQPEWLTNQQAVIEKTQGPSLAALEDQESRLQYFRQILEKNLFEAWMLLETQGALLEKYYQKVALLELLKRMEQFSEMESEAEAVLSAPDENQFIPRIRFYYHWARARQNKVLNGPFENLEAQLSHDDRQLLEPFHGMLREYFFKNNQPVLALYHEIKRAELPGIEQSVVHQHLQEIINSISNESICNQIELQYSKNPLILQLVQIKQTELLMNQKRYVQAQDYLTRKLSSEEAGLASNHQLKLTNLQNRLWVKTRVVPTKIGVILPLSAKPAQIAQLAKDAMEGVRLSLIDFQNRRANNQDNSNRSPRSTIELIFRDSYLNPQQTEDITRSLIEDEHVIAIIGPLIRTTSEAAARIAQEYQVPLITLTQTASIAEVGDYVFRINENWAEEEKKLADYAIDYAQVRSFAVLYPQTREGKEKLGYFWEQVEKRERTIATAYGFYPKQKTFLDAFDEFTGARRYLSETDKLIMEEIEEKQQQPIRDFDGVFIPLGADNMDTANIIFPYSSAYGMDKLFYAGDSGWNNPAIVHTIRGHVRKHVFTGSFSRENPDEEVQKFMRMHERYFYQHLNYKGPSIYTAFAYDAAGILISLITQNKVQDHQQLREQLVNLQNYHGVSGMLKFQQNGDISRKLSLYRVFRRQIRPVDL